MTSPRPYNSPLRAERAEQTRSTILRAARRLFETQGFTATTIKDIADEAAVSVPTVYAAFGSKAALVTGLLDQLEADAADDQHRHAPPGDADAALHTWLDAHTRIFERGQPLLRVMLRALSEPAVAELAAEGDRHRRHALHDVIARFAEANRLRPGLNSVTAVDEAWALSSVGVYLDLTDHCGWTTTQYRDWLHSSFSRLLLKE
ncbi:MAG TPA: TetR/AcrR family transcriptional regulator [Jiangellaceae bacterium]